MVITVDKLTIGTRIKYERQKLGLTLEELGNQLGVSKQGLSGWEHDIIALAEMAKIFNIHIEDFLQPIDFFSLNNKVDNNTLVVTDKELLLINKFRSLNSDKRKAIETLFGIK